MWLICPKCKSLFQVEALNLPATYITEHYEEIDKTTGRCIEIICGCKEPLVSFEEYIKETAEDIVIDYIIEQSIRKDELLKEKLESISK